MAESEWEAFDVLALKEEEAEGMVDAKAEESILAVVAFPLVTLPRNPKTSEMAEEEEGMAAKHYYPTTPSTNTNLPCIPWLTEGVNGDDDDFREYGIPRTLYPED